MGIKLNGGSFYMTYADDYLIELGKSIDMSMEYAEETMPILNGLNKNASFTCEVHNMDLGLLESAVTIAPSDKFDMVYYLDIMRQKRWHKKARVNKKWLKRYGMKPDTIMVIMDVIPLVNEDFQFECSNHRYILRSDQQRKGLKIVW